ncbi:MAG TPA: glycerate kinase [Thermodesulfobacteriota bacterium]|nr:glycerate kinase [Thermodesulfobacteriota bacterium]
MKRSLDPLRRDAKKIFLHAIHAVQPQTILSSHISLRNHVLRIGERKYPLSRYEKIFVAGTGKASASMAVNLEKILGTRITRGLINVKYGHSQKLKRIRVQEAGHPLPDEKGLEGAKEMVEMLSHLTGNDLVIFLVSGGGSALLPLPVEGVTLVEKQATTNELLSCGASIQEINTLRKHLSRIKGGGLAKIVYPATLVSLILSDVIGDPLDAIASGPTVPDSTTYENCAWILNKYELWGKIPPSVASHIRAGMEGRKEETLKEGDPAFAKVYNLIVGNNLLAMTAARKAAQALGYRTLLLSSLVEGETREIAKVHAAIAKEVLLSGNPIPPPACILSGGETTVTLKGKGKGGRNQEFALAGALEIAGCEEILMMSAGTDGTDGPTDAAGAFADGKTVIRAKTMGLDPWSFLKENDSYSFFQRIGDLLTIGPTGTNVMDLRIMLVTPPNSPKGTRTQRI